MAAKRKSKRASDSNASAAVTGADLEAPDGDKPVDIEAELQKLSPEQAAMFVDMLELAMKKRRMMLLGYLTALVVLVAGSVFSLWAYATHEPGTFIGWAMLVPFAGVGVVFIVFSRLTKRIGKDRRGEN